MSENTDALSVGGQTYRIYPVNAVSGAEKLPYSLRILVENVLRCVADPAAREAYVQRVMQAGLAGEQGGEIEYMPARVLLQDFTGVPVFVDLAAMREAARDLGGDPNRINPQIPLDLVIDHSVIADVAGCADAAERNMEMEFARNAERYRFLKWAQDSFSNVRIVPPGAGICHQINVERFATGVMTREDASGAVAYFDTVVGTDSHTTTANGLGVLSWGVGGIEAEAACLGQPITTLVPRVVGVRLTGRLQEGVSAMDVALRFAKMLRAKGVVGAFVECFGEGVRTLSATQRACIANMTPEYGCTCTLFPVDEQTIDYLRLTGRSEHQVALVKAYAQAQGLWLDDAEERVYTDVIELDLATVKRTLAGPSRPHDAFDAACAKSEFARICTERSLDRDAAASAAFDGKEYRLTHGAVAIAAVTSCTTATDPAMMAACGLVAKHARERGLCAKPWVKRIMAPGSHATQAMLERAGLADALSELGFSTCGFGCMSCIGNSGPIWPQMHEISGDIELASVLSGNRNFEGRISPDVAQNYLCAPALVVAYAIAGMMDFDFEADPLGCDATGAPVYLRDIWPADEEIERALAAYATPELFEEGGRGLYEGTEAWKSLTVEPSALFAWDEQSTYVRHAPYFEGMGAGVPGFSPIKGARVLVNLRDFITTDHISPAGSIPEDSPAARYLEERGVTHAMFNTYGSRRGNHEVMARGGFGNVKIKNLLAEGRSGGVTRDFTTGEITSVYDASRSYAASGTPLVVLAGKMYGSGSSRDWAAKAPLLLGVRAVIAESFERIHRSNLVGMGILPLQFMEGESAETLGLNGTETFSVEAIDFGSGEPCLPNPSIVKVSALQQDGGIKEFHAIVRVDTPTEGAYMAHGGILQYVLRQLVAHAG